MAGVEWRGAASHIGLQGSPGWEVWRGNVSVIIFRPPAPATHTQNLDAEHPLQVQPCVSKADPQHSPAGGADHPHFQVGAEAASSDVTCF